MDHNEDSSHHEGNFTFIGLDFEDRNEALNISVNKAMQDKCDALIFFNKNTFPKEDIVNKLFSPLEDPNIFATFSDYTIDNILMIHNNPTVICRRLENSEDLHDLSKCEGIVKYIPLNLYNVNTN